MNHLNVCSTQHVIETSLRCNQQRNSCISVQPQIHFKYLNHRCFVVKVVCQIYAYLGMEDFWFRMPNFFYGIKVDMA